MSAVPAPKYISIEEYLLMEEDSEVKHEYCHGEIFAMAERFRTTKLSGTH